MSGTIDLYEFQALWHYIQQWKNTFDRYDSNKSGSIESHELHQGKVHSLTIITEMNKKNFHHLNKIIHGIMNIFCTFFITFVSDNISEHGGKL